MLVRLSTAISTAMGCGISRYGAADLSGTGVGFRKKLGQLQIRNDPSVVVTASSDRSTVPLLNEGASRDHDLIRLHAKGKGKRKRRGNRHNKKKKKNNNNNNNNNNNAIEVDDDNDDRMTNGSKNEIHVVVAEGGGRNNDDDEEYSDQVDDHDQGRISDFEGIGSPSFREYCHCNVDHCDSDGSCKEDGSSTTVDEEKIRATTINVYQGSVSNSKTMDSGRKKGRRFIKVFSGGGGGSSSALAMKNFLHVTACYNPNNTY